MWSRSILKSNAKLAIGKGKYIQAFFASAIVMLIATACELLAGDEMTVRQAFTTMFLTRDASYAAVLAIRYFGILFVTNLLINNPLTVGECRYFIRNRFNAGEYKNLFQVFSEGYGNVVGSIFVTNLFISLWTLLLVVPGVIKALQYFMVTYLLSDNPRLSGKRAREISRLMTEGEKGSIFVLMLSFIGWLLIPLALSMFISGVIGAILSAVAMMLIMPYYNATFAELYIFLRDRAIQTGMVLPEELGLSTANQEVAVGPEIQ